MTKMQFPNFYMIWHSQCKFMYIDKNNFLYHNVPRQKSIANIYVFWWHCVHGTIDEA